MQHGMTRRFEIRVAGWLDDHWAPRFDGVNLRLLADGDTILEGLVPDQGALSGILRALDCFGLTVVCVKSHPDGENPW